MNAEARRVAIVGAGWAGLAASVRAVEAGHAVTLYDMAAAPGGRAREVEHADHMLDNGQHILIGAYDRTLALMRSVGADPQALLSRRPLALVDASGRGLRLPAGAPVPAFVRAVIARKDWTWRERAWLLWTLQGWRWRGFAVDEDTTVAALIAPLPERARRQLFEPLCVAALNTPAHSASAPVFLRVLRDVLFGGAGASDLLLPRASLSALLPRPAAAWLSARGADLRWGTRVQSLARNDGGGWRVEGQAVDAVVLACTANEAARLAAASAPAWSALAAAFDYEPIVTVYLDSPGTRWRDPMVALAEDDRSPAQFAFDLGALAGDGTRQGLFAFVVSGARAWVERGLDATAQAVLAQAASAFAPGTWHDSPRLVKTLAERRATFLCTPRLARPAARIAPSLVAAGDYIEGPYPATLEGAVRAGEAAVQLIADARGAPPTGHR